MAGKVSALCDRKTVKRRDIRKQMSKGNVNFTSINYYMINNRKKLKILFSARIRNKLEMND